MILSSKNHTQVKPGEGCDVCFINTCAVTAESVRKSRQAVRRLQKAEPDALIAVCGCASQLEPSTFEALGAGLVGGSGDRLGFIAKLEQLAENRSDAASRLLDAPENRRFFEQLPPGQPSGRTRALLKIQDGCENYCAYCIVPYVRGPVRSLPPTQAAESAGRLAEQGAREIVITGIEISSYGKDLKDHPTLTDVLLAVSESAPGARLRLSSLDPGAITRDFCAKLGEVPNLCDHFHLSLQSGCDDTLRRMGRKYDSDTVLEAITSLRRLFPDCGLTADLITGFPGETNEEFRQTMEFIKTAAFSDMHIFPFSPRPGTAASDMPGQTDKKVRQDRARLAAAAALDMARGFRLGQVGKTVDVLFERKRGGLWIGHSGNYIEVAVASGGAKNSVCPVRITCVQDDGVLGEIV